MDRKISLNWEEWVDFCAEHSLDPVENCECSFDLGGGDTETYYCYDPPESDK